MLSNRLLNPDAGLYVMVRNFPLSGPLRRISRINSLIVQSIIEVQAAFFFQVGEMDVVGDSDVIAGFTFEVDGLGDLGLELGLGSGL